MTRGTFWLLTDKKAYSSTEFNGDMYPATIYEGTYRAGLGSVAFDLLIGVTSPQDFGRMIIIFNELHRKYGGRLIYTNSPDEIKENLNFELNYFPFRFSEYLFIKNTSSHVFNFILRDSKNNFELVPGETAMFRYGRFERSTHKGYNQAQHIAKSAGL